MVPFDGNAMFLSQMAAISFLCSFVVIMMGFSTSVLGGWDLALTLHRPTWSVDTNPDPHSDPSRVVDGTGDSMITGLHSYPWWAVDLGQDVEIAKCFIKGLAESIEGRRLARDRLYMAVGPVAPPIASGADLTGTPFKQCEYYILGTLPNHHISCSPGTRGRYMYIYSKRQTPSHMTLFEVRLQGTKIPLDSVGDECDLNNCSSCHTDGTCAECINGTIYTDGKCVTECLRNHCEHCNVDGTCARCINGTTLINGTCTECLLENCEQCNADGACAICANGTMLDNGNCTDSCVTTGNFEYFPNQKGKGGERHLIKGTLMECKTACVNNDACTALDWRSSPNSRCWLYLSPVHGMQPHKHMDHYRRCPIKP